jgi:hypothetical protein
MASVPDVVGLLHRADWTRLSLAAEVSTGIDPVLSWKSTQAAMPPWQLRKTPEPEGPDGFRSRRLELLIAPGPALPRRTRGLRVGIGVRRRTPLGSGRPRPARRSGLGGDVR